MICNNCGTENTDSAKFCVKCGLAVTAMNVPTPKQEVKNPQPLPPLGEAGRGQGRGINKPENVSNKTRTIMAIVVGGILLVAIAITVYFQFIKKDDKANVTSVPTENKDAKETKETKAKPEDNSIPKNFDKHYTGLISGTHINDFHLICAHYELSGNYSTEDGFLNLKGNIDMKNNITINVSGPNSVPAGTIKGKLNDIHNITGTWFGSASGTDAGGTVSLKEIMP